MRAATRGRDLGAPSGTREDCGCSGISERGSSVAYLLPRLALQGPLQRLGERPAGEIFETVMKTVDPLVMQVSLSRHGHGGGAQERPASSDTSSFERHQRAALAAAYSSEILHFTNLAVDAKEIHFSPSRAGTPPKLTAIPSAPSTSRPAARTSAPSTRPPTSWRCPSSSA